MAEFTHLYILVFPEKGIIKIGKADEVHERIQILKRWWGDADYDASYHLFAPTDLIFRLEKSLHFLLSNYAVNYEEGDGRTELFSNDALPTVLKHIDLFYSSGAVVEPIKKGVILPPPSVASQKRRQRSYVKYEKKNASLFASVTTIAEKFSRLNRLLIILFRKQGRIAYQYDIKDGYVYFRLQLPSLQAQEQYGSVMQVLSYQIEDFNGWRGVNCCTVTYSEGILQYRVQLLSDGESGSQESIICYFFRQSQYLLSRLPSRSAAARNEIPMLNESEIYQALMVQNEGIVL